MTKNIQIERVVDLINMMIIEAGEEEKGFDRDDVLSEYGINTIQNAFDFANDLEKNFETHTDEEEIAVTTGYIRGLMLLRDRLKIVGSISNNQTNILIEQENNLKRAMSL